MLVPAAPGADAEIAEAIAAQALVMELRRMAPTLPVGTVPAGHITEQVLLPSKAQDGAYPVLLSFERRSCRVVHSTDFGRVLQILREVLIKQQAATVAANARQSVLDRRWLKAHVVRSLRP